MESEKMQMSVASLKKTVPKREGNYFNYVHSFDATVTVSIKAPEKMSCHLCDRHNKKKNLKKMRIQKETTLCESVGMCVQYECGMCQ